jgi:hypothetical protein
MTTVKDELLQKDVEAYFRAEADLKAGLVELTPESASRAIIDFALAAREADKTMKDARFTELLREFGATIRTQSRLAVPEGSGNGCIVRAACRSGILTEVEESAVDNMFPWEVTQLADKIAETISKAFEIPKA